LFFSLVDHGTFHVCLIDDFEAFDLAKFIVLGAERKVTMRMNIMLMTTPRRIQNITIDRKEYHGL
jgi:hypothetical protein